MKKLLLSLGIFSAFSTMALAGNSGNKVGIGLGLGVSNSLYKGDEDSKAFPMPLLDIKYGDAFIKGTRIGYNVYKQDRLALSLFVDPMTGFKMKGDDMKSGYKNINDRDTQAMAGIGLSYNTGINSISTTLSYAWGEHGSRGAIAAFRPFRLTDRILVIPGVNINYFSGDYANYYFGVSQEEANRPGNYKLRGKAYEAEDSFSIGATVSAEYMWNENMSLMLFTGIEKFSKEVSDSPIVDTDALFMMGAGFRYTFR